MKLIRYFLYRKLIIIYPTAAAVISLVIGITLDRLSNFAAYFVPVLLLLFCLRVQDDIFDYGKDRDKKEQALSKGQLILLDAVLWLLYFASNVLFYGIAGYLSIFLVAYTLLFEKLTVLKVLLAPLMFLYLSWASECLSFTCAIYGIAVFGICASAYYYIKKGKRQ